MQTTFVQAFEDKDAAIKALGFFTARDFKVYFVDGTDMADLRGFRADGTKSAFGVGEIDDKKVYVLLATKDPVEVD